MTSISQWLDAEQPDRSEEVTFYVPGAKGWNDPNLSTLWIHLRRRRPPPAVLAVALEWQEDEGEQEENE